MPEEGEPRQINSASALWQRPKSELSPEDYKQAYQQVAGAFDEPAMTLHYRAEGRQSYAVMLFAPSTKPFDLFDQSVGVNLLYRLQDSPMDAASSVVEHACVGDLTGKRVLEDEFSFTLGPAAAPRRR